MAINEHLLTYYTLPFTNHTINHNNNSYGINYDSFQNSIVSATFAVANFNTNNTNFLSTYPLRINNITDGHATYNHAFDIEISRTGDNLPLIGNVPVDKQPSINVCIKTFVNAPAEYRASISWRVGINNFIVSPPQTTTYAFLSSQLVFTSSTNEFNLTTFFFSALEQAASLGNISLVDNYREIITPALYTGSFTLNVMHIRNITNAIDMQYQVGTGRVLANGIDLYKTTFESFGSFLSTELMPNVSIGGLLSIPLTLVCVIAIIKLIRG